MFGICTLLVCSYIFFDVLDLDGSNFLRLLTSVERSIIVAETATSGDFLDSLGAVHGDAIARQIPDHSEQCNIPRQKRSFNFSPVTSAREHRYRVSLARNSLPEASPYL